MNPTLRFGRLSLLSAVAVFAAACSDCGGSVDIPCSTNADCSATDVCTNGKCVPGNKDGGTGGNGGNAGGGTGGSTGGGTGGSGGGGMGDVFSCTKPLTCAKQGFDCGAAGDGCGGLLNCGTCTAPETCGAKFPGQCGFAAARWQWAGR